VSVDSDSSLIKSFVSVLGGLVLFTACIMYLATVVAPPNDYSSRLVQDSILSRIEPIGKVRTAADVPAADATQTADAGGEEGGVPAAIRTAVDSVCGACHASGVAGAPKFGDKATWDARAEAGLDGMTATVISGKGAMPPRGGTQLSDAELLQAVEYMLTK